MKNLDKYFIGILILLFCGVCVPIYITFTHFGYIEFGEFYSGATSICMFIGLFVSAITVSNTK